MNTHLGEYPITRSAQPTTSPSPPERIWQSPETIGVVIRGCSQDGEAGTRFVFRQGVRPISPLGRAFLVWYRNRIAGVPFRSHDRVRYLARVSVDLSAQR